MFACLIKKSDSNRSQLNSESICQALNTSVSAGNLSPSTVELQPAAALSSPILTVAHSVYQE